MFKIGTNKLEKEVYMQKISRNRYKLIKICINIPINIKISAYFVVKYHTIVVNCGKIPNFCGKYR